MPTGKPQRRDTAPAVANCNRLLAICEVSEPSNESNPASYGISELGVVDAIDK